MSAPDHPLVRDPASLLALGRQILQQESCALDALSAQLDPQALHAALSILLECEGMIMISGAGTSSSIARRLAHLLTCSGLPSVFVDPGQSQHGYAAVIRQKDAVIGFSRGGETDDLNHLLRYARAQGAKVIGILENPNSTMARLSDVFLRAPVSRENDAMGVIPLASTLAHAAVGDILCAAVQAILGFSETQFSLIHPGGAVGKRLSQGSGAQ